jgi:hypothetical protein
VHKRSRGTYGMLRIRAALEIEQGIIVNKKLILRLMRELGIQGLPGPKKGRHNMVNLATAVGSLLEEGRGMGDRPTL